MKKPTRQQLEERLYHAQVESGRMHQAINDLCNGSVTWFRSGKYRVGISRPNGAEGGICFQQYLERPGKRYTSVHSWEHVWPQVRDTIPALNTQDGRSLYQAMVEASAHVYTEQQKAAA